MWREDWMLQMPWTTFGAAKRCATVGERMQAGRQTGKRAGRAEQKRSTTQRLEQGRWCAGSQLTDSEWPLVISLLALLDGGRELSRGLEGAGQDRARTTVVVAGGKGGNTLGRSDSKKDWATTAGLCRCDGRRAETATEQHRAGLGWVVGWWRGREGEEQLLVREEKLGGRRERRRAG